MLCGYVPSERKAHFELAKEFFLSRWNISTKHKDLILQISAEIPRMLSAVLVRSNCKEKFLHLATLPPHSRTAAMQGDEMQSYPGPHQS